MAIAIDKLDIGGFISDSSTFTFTTTQTVASGGFIVLGYTYYSATGVLTAASGGGLAWVIDKHVNLAGDGSQNFAIISAQAPVGLASGTLIDLTAHTGDLPAVATAKASSFTGVATSSPVDGTPTGPTADTEPWETASYTIAAGSVIVALCQLQANSTNTPTAPSIELWDAAMGSYNSCAEYRIEAAGGAYQVAGTWGTAATTTNIAVAYKAAAGAPTDTTTRRYQIRRSRMTSW